MISDNILVRADDILVSLDILVSADIFVRADIFGHQTTNFQSRQHFFSAQMTLLEQTFCQTRRHCHQNRLFFPMQMTLSSEQTFFVKAGDILVRPDDIVKADIYQCVK